MKRIINTFRHNYSLRGSLLALFLFALSLRLIAVAAIPVQVWEYETLAVNILNGQGFSYPHFTGIAYHAYCEPLYPICCAVFYALFGHRIILIEIVQAILSALLPILIFFCARRVYSQRIAYLASLLTALHPGLIVYITKIHPLTIDTLIIAAVLLAMLKLCDSLSAGNILLCGITTGVCFLTKPIIAIFILIGLIYIFNAKRVGLKKAAAYTAIFFFAAASFSLPWAARNYTVYKKIVLTRSIAPFVFWLGNNPHATGSAVDKTGRPIFNLTPDSFKEKIKGLNELQQNKEFLKDSLNYIKERPAAFLFRSAKKFYYFWWFSPQAGIFYPRPWSIGYKAFYLLILFCGIYAIAFNNKISIAPKSEKIKLILLFLFSLSAAQSLFYVETRHRWAIEPVFLIFSAAGIYAILNKKGERNENH